MIDPTLIPDSKSLITPEPFAPADEAREAQTGYERERGREVDAVVDGGVER